MSAQPSDGDVHVHSPVCLSVCVCVCLSVCLLMCIVLHIELASTDVSHHKQAG